ncbi:MAG: hypothetical protein ABIJ03_03740 [Patescibacteria group bacterium]|nr:hypothetical protein [Patescibacteria group bacterium]
MTKLIENLIWITGTIVILGVLMVERVFGPPLIGLWLFSLFISKLKTGLRFWLTLVVVDICLAITFNLSFGLASLIVAGLSLLVQQFSGRTKLWLGLGVILGSGLICWLNQMNINYFGWWLLVVCLGVTSWWLGRRSSLAWGG